MHYCDGHQDIKLVTMAACIFICTEKGNFSLKLTYQLFLSKIVCSISASSSSQGLSQPSTQTTQYLRADTPNNATPITSYPTLRIEKNDLRSVTLLEAKAKVKDIAISRERITLKDVLQEGTFGRIFHGILVDEKDPNKEKQAFVKTVKDQASEIQVTMMLTESCKLRGLHHRNLLPITHVCIEDGEKPMVILPYMNWGNLKLFLRQCKLVEANNPQVRKICPDINYLPGTSDSIFESRC